MKWTGLNELRVEFLKFFKSKGHTIMESSSLVPKDDNSLLLINSGMAPLKKFFLGQATPPNKRVVSCQKCIRTPDIERVGKTARHGTYFEMLGNFSFGDYFKIEAIEYAWEFTTKVMKLPEDKVWISIYLEDDETFDIWTKHMNVPKEKIVRLGKEDNFWEHGSGPCGPCTELYFDRGEEHGCCNPDCAVGCDCDRYVEFWNLVFSQFNNDGKGNYTPMKNPNIDTGMGLERLACIMQGVDNLFEVDTVKSIMEHISKIANVEYKKDAKKDVSLRVITDHIRSTTFMVCDGVIPSNEGRGYVLRRLLRRASRHGMLLGINELFLYKVVDTVIEQNKIAYPELEKKADYIKKVIKAEETSFNKTIENGMELVNELIEKIKKEKCNKLSGDDAFKLYDTFGFPLDLTIEIVEENNITVDTYRFDKLMLEQKTRAREARLASGNTSWEKEDINISKPTEFVGYTQNSCDAEVLAILIDGKSVEKACSGNEVGIILNKTPFYAESGGQIGDSGNIISNGFNMEINRCTKSASGLFVHSGKILDGEIKLNQKVQAVIDEIKREDIKRNHTAAHLLQAALIKVLGDHVHQAGQLVDEKGVRFDFTHLEQVTSEQLSLIELLVNQEIMKATEVNVFETDIETAKNSGAIALFGEKYGDIVRVCKVSDFSTELCGGTHIENTGKIGLFKIVSESSVASGVRRIEAKTGFGVLGLLNESNNTLNKIANEYKLSNAKEVLNKTINTINEVKQKNKIIESLNAKLANYQLDNLNSKIENINGFDFVCDEFPDLDASALRNIGDNIKEKYPNIVCALTGAYNDESGNLLVVCSKDAVNNSANAGKFVKEIAPIAGGKGGGRPDSAMAGITQTNKANDCFEALKDLLKK